VKIYPPSKSRQIRFRSTGETGVVGIDTRADTDHVAVVTEYGKSPADQEFPTTSAGCQEAFGFITGFGGVPQVGMGAPASSRGRGVVKCILGNFIPLVDELKCKLTMAACIDRCGSSYG
jgi:hypothetical protein